MTTAASASADAAARLEHLDVLVVGAGLSGIGVTARLRRDLPGLDVAVLEARASLGGTWDLFRYPGVRSDSDMFTFGYQLEPWTDPVGLADGDAILRYLQRTAQRYGVDRLVRYRHRVEAARWDGGRARWTVLVSTPTGERSLTCDLLLLCAGYYRYDEGYTPDWPGRADFAGQVVHPQHWPADLDVNGRDVVVVGSGATAVTLVPALARAASHVTMLQRSPTHLLPIPSRDPLAERLLRVLPPRAAHPVLRWRNVATSQGFYALSRRRPALVRGWLRRVQEPLLPPDFDLDTHLTPTYEPWDQRLCVVRDGDLFAAITSGRASIVTDTLERFEPAGLRLGSGALLAADVVVTATGFTLQPMGGLQLEVDGVPVVLPERHVYKGMMLDGVPNMVFVVGYTNASWTLKADLVAAFAVRLLRRMRRRGYRRVVPRAPSQPGEGAPLIDLSAGYVRRSRDALPRQGLRYPWRLRQSYPGDVLALRAGRLEDGVLAFSR
jgi:cation diffusion facilitator CzcD-associated flavoprotein CzcO